jgi:hypothetical protein
VCKGERVRKGEEKEEDDRTRGRKEMGKIEMERERRGELVAS